VAASSLSRVVDLHKALGHPLRLRLVAMLREGPLCVCQMTGVLRRAASTVSEHLSELRRAGAIQERKDGRWVEYRLSEDPVTRAALEAAWPELEQDADVRADLVVLRELRKVSLEEICKVDLDLTRVPRAGLAKAVLRAAKLRESRP
jgi:ArsR family transcriptional regulator, arsenate/arsenite/antimonite-responsive transcriptional repressor